MTETFPIEFADGRSATAVRVTTLAELPGALGALGLMPPRPTVVVVGGAGGLEEADLDRLRSLFTEAIVPAIQAHHAAGVDGGTLSGVMRLFGETRAAAGAGFPLVGVAAEGTVLLPGDACSGDVCSGGQAELETRHSHFVIVPGDQWGDESPWIARAATILAGGAPSITVLINGGQIALDDVERSREAGREVIVIEGSGRSADALTAALAGATADDRAAEIAARGGLRPVRADDPAGLARALSAALGGVQEAL